MSKIKIFSKIGLISFSNFIDVCRDKEIFFEINKFKPSKMIFFGLDGNAKWDYIRKNNFPTVKTVVYFGSYTNIDINGLYGFDTVLVSKDFNPIHMTENFRYMTGEEEKFYMGLVDKLPEKVEESKFCLHSGNFDLYNKLKNSKAQIELIE